MSSRVFSGGPRTTTSQSKRTGFAEQDINKFLLAGDTQSTQASGVTGPSQVSQFSRTTFNQDTPSLLGRFAGQNATTQTSVQKSGFQGKFSDLNQEDVDILLQNFQNRQSLILGQKRAPGRQQLLLSNR